MDEVSRIVKDGSFITWRRSRGWEPINIVKAEGVYLYDSTGRKYLDLSSQLINVNLGHGNKAVIESIKKSLDSLQYVSPIFATETRARAIKALLEIMPKNIKKFFFSTSGTEANEAAVKIVRNYKFPSYKILARYRSYHGSTLASISLTGDYRRWFVEPNVMGGVVRFPEPYCFRCPLKLKYPDCNIACANYVEYIIKQEGKVAGIIVEPITGSNGVIVPPKEYLPLLWKIAKDNDVIFIADEVMTGWGRVGSWFAIERWKVEPDIITTAKGASASYLPIGITAVSEEIAEFYEDNVFPHGHTFEAHPIVLATIPAVIEEYKRLNILEHVIKMESYVKKRLEELRERHKSIGDVRGLGLFWAIELVRDNKNTPIADYQDKYSGNPTLMDLISKKLLENGVYVFTGPSWLIIAPPLIIREEELDYGIEKLDEVLKIADNEYKELF
ncbi:MAG: aspartate aminotransferase family protein [Sulfolobaceae archaeon]